MPDNIHATVDMTDFNRAFKEYMQVTSRTLQEAVNQKLFDVCRFALKETYKPDAGTIRSAMKTTCDKYPLRTVAEMIAIMKNRGHEFDLAAEARKVTNKAAGAAGYTRSGWIKPMVKLMPFIGKSSFTANGVSKNVGPGDAMPVTHNASNLEGAVWNDVTAITHDALVTQYKENGVQLAINAVVADIDNYIEKKLAAVNKAF
jgi:hypothetical protein